MLVGIDFLSYYGGIHRFKHGGNSFPTYLYDENILNDYKYLISSDTLGRAFEIFAKREKDDWLYDYTKMYEWRSRTNDKDVLKAIKSRWENRQDFDNEASEDEKRLHFLKNNFDVNLKPLIDQNLDVKFTLFFPPYSILAYKTYEERGQLKSFIEFKKYIVQSLSRYKNATIYDFQLADDVTYDLNNYYDLYHYNKHISKWILQQIKYDKYRVTGQGEERKNREFLKKITDYNVTQMSFSN